MSFLIVHNIESCTCSDFTNENGFGKCQKASVRSVSPQAIDAMVCYVNQPSNCNDLYDSTTNPDKQLSAEACRYTGEIVRRFLVYYYILRRTRLILKYT